MKSYAGELIGYTLVTVIVGGIINTSSLFDLWAGLHRG